MFWSAVFVDTLHTRQATGNTCDIGRNCMHFICIKQNKSKANPVTGSGGL
jgi:hypothetical protein